MKNRSELRDIIVKVMYQKYIFDSCNIAYNLDDIKEEFLETENEFVDSLLNGIIDNQEYINNMANKYLKDWTIDRLSKVDKAILSLGIYELLFTKTPSIVSINEAIELSKKYSDDKVIKMINATLDSVYHNECEDEQ